MNILTLDTSTPILSISLRTDNSYEERKIIGSFSHSENLLGEIKSLLERVSLTLQDLNLLVCTKGPGSFTGLRVGMASLKGISAASSASLVSIPTLRAITKSVEDLYSGPILSVIDAKKKRFYYTLTIDKEVIVEPRDGDIDEIISNLDYLDTQILLTGPDATLLATKLEEKGFSRPILLDPCAPRSLCYALETLGLERFKEKGADDIGEGPIYIRRSDAEEMLRSKMMEK